VDNRKINYDNSLWQSCQLKGIKMKGKKKGKEGKPGKPGKATKKECK